ncbi:DNL-type zinc finger protein [Vitis vinifera]|uniref:DNL-type zinc finger protein n=1 Tax=Vitis vinifera TaxID=29760 RepID=A0A438HIU5_VITVI|nr:DNL-type zinc finger protein [Vitis vinifera]
MGWCAGVVGLFLHMMVLNPLGNFFLLQVQPSPGINFTEEDWDAVHCDVELEESSRHDLAMIFTCKVCETRSVKTACRESYERGVVVVRCDGCSNLHLIADRLGWFGEPGSIEDFLDARGEEVKKGSADTLNLTLEDLAGMKP